MTNFKGRRCALMARSDGCEHHDAHTQLRILRAFAIQHQMRVAEEIWMNNLVKNSWAQAALMQKVERGEVDAVLVADVRLLARRPGPLSLLLGRFKALGVAVVAIIGDDVLVGTGGGNETAPAGPGRCECGQGRSVRRLSGVGRCSNSASQGSTSTSEMPFSRLFHRVCPTHVGNPSWVFRTP
jgi:hypothetical protein